MGPFLVEETDLLTGLIKILEKVAEGMGLTSDLLQPLLP
jgi:hypothetical protein